MCNQGVNALVVAARNNESSKVQMLLACPEIDINGYEDGTKGPALVVASIKGHVEVVKELLKDVNIDGNKVNKGNNGGQTPLCLASLYGNLDVIKELLWDARVDLNLKNEYGNTPLIVAVKAKQIEATKLLLRCPRVDITLSSSNDASRRDYGKTALDIATRLGEKGLMNAIQTRPTLLEDGHTCNEQGEQKLIWKVIQRAKRAAV